MDNYRRIKGGYTIIEVTIVLTVSSLLFATAVTAFIGQNNRTRFTESVNNFSQDLQDILNDVETGYYPVSGNFRCTAPAASGRPTIGGATDEQGKHSNCTFVGKAIQFAPGGNGSQADIYTVVGRRTIGTPPRVVATIDESAPTTLTSLNVDRKFLTSDVEVYDVQNAANSGVRYAGIAMVSNSDTGGGTLSSGLNARAALASVGTSFGGSFNPAIQALGTDDINQARTGINICLREAGGNGRFAILRIGTDRSQIVIDTRMDEQCPA